MLESKMAKALIKAINGVKSDGDAPLHLAVRDKRIASIQMLLEKEVDVNVQNGRGNPPLYEDLAFVCDNDLLDLFLRRGAKVDLKNRQGENALHLAVRADNMRSNKFEVVRKLLDVGGGLDVNEANERGQTVLHLTLDNDHVIAEEVFNFTWLLVERGANVNVVDTDDKTPLYLAVRNRRDDVVKYLVKRGADVNGHGGCMPIFETLANQDPAMFRYLVEQKARTDVKDDRQQTLLHAVIRHIDDLFERFEMVRQLIEDAGDVEVTDRDCKGRTAIYYALKRRDKDTFHLLVVHGGLVDVKNDEGESLLYTAVEVKMFDVVKSLVSRGWDVNDRDSRGVSLLLLTVLQHDTRIFRFLLDSNAKVDRNLLLAVVRVGSPKMLNLIEESRGEIDREGLLGRESFVTAVKKHTVEMVHYLLESGADVELEFKGSLPLKHAVEASSGIKFKETSLPTLVNHLAVLKSLNLYVSGENVRLIDFTPRLKQWFGRCITQLESMKSHRIVPEIDFTFYDLLTGRYSSESFLRITSTDCMKILERSESENFYTLFDNYILELEMGLSCFATRVLKSVVPITTVRDILDHYGVRDLGVIYDYEAEDCRRRYRPRDGWVASCLLNVVAAINAGLGKVVIDKLYNRS